MEEDRPPMDMMDKDALLDDWLEEREFKRKNKGTTNIPSNAKGDIFEA